MQHDVVQYDHSVRDYNNRIIESGTLWNKRGPTKFLHNQTGLDPKWQVHVPGHGTQFADLEAALVTWQASRRRP